MEGPSFVVLKGIGIQLGKPSGVEETRNLDPLPALLVGVHPT